MYVHGSAAGQYSRSTSEVGRVGPAPLDCAALSIALSISSLAVLDGVMEQPGKLISRANKVDGRGPCERSGGAPGPVGGSVMVAVVVI